MKPEEINVAIGQKLKAQIGTNYRCFVPGQDGEIIFCSECDAIELCENAPQYKYQRYPVYPNYYEDLNAIHKAEKILNNSQYHTFTLMLSEKAWDLFPHQTKDSDYKARLRIFCSATAPQRCEAFLRTIGKWVETKGEESC